MKRTVGWIALTAAVILLCLFTLTSCGETAGKSAYEIAVQNGFEGTESEWLDSLKGTDGKDGKDGVDGVDGLNGIDGEDGKDSVFSLKDYYDAAVEAGFEGTYLDFIQTKCSALTMSYDDVAVISKNLLSSVCVVSAFNIRYQVVDFFRGAYLVDDTTTSYGSGVLYKTDLEGGDAYVITNYHVVYHSYAVTDNHISDNIGVVLYGYSSENAISATYVGGSSAYDIAVLKIEKSAVLSGSEAQSAVFTDSDLVSAGQTAVAIGNAGGKGIAVTKGVVSVDSETETFTTGTARVMRVDCAINEGNSGGGLFDSSGKLIGIVNAKQESSAVDNIAYAIPANVVRNVVENVLYYREKEGSGQGKKYVLGISLVDENAHAHYDETLGKTYVLADVTVDEEAEIEEGALAGGVLQAGDVIKFVAVKRAGEETFAFPFVVRRSFTVVDLMLTLRKGDVVRFSIVRDGEETTAELTLGDVGIEVIE